MAVPSLARTARRVLRSQRDGHALSRHAVGKAIPPVHSAFFKPAIPMGETVPTQGLPRPMLFWTSGNCWPGKWPVLRWKGLTAVAVPSLAWTARRALGQRRDDHALPRRAVGETTPQVHSAFIKPAIPMGEAVPTQGLPRPMLFWTSGSGWPFKWPVLRWKRLTAMAVPSFARTARRALRLRRDGHALSRHAVGDTAPPVHSAFLKPAIPMGETVPTQGLPRPLACTARGRCGTIRAS